jgi:fermentation-respiration switch protein FrsA (DUF1100 family)
MNRPFANGYFGCKLLLLSLLLLTATGCQALERKFVYNAKKYSRHLIRPSPFELSGLSLEEACFESSDGTCLHGWFLQPAGERPTNTILYTHGRSGNVYTHKSKLFEFVKRHQIAVFIFDYRGFGTSDGKPDEPGLYRDASAALDWLVNRTGLARSEVVIMGRSLGVPVAIDLAAREGGKALILENGLTSVHDVIRHHTHDLISLRRIIDACFDSTRKIGQFSGPVFISHGREDKGVPISQSIRLAESATSASRVEFFEAEGGHRANQSEIYHESLNQFLQSL